MNNNWAYLTDEFLPCMDEGPLEHEEESLNAIGDWLRESYQFFTANNLIIDAPMRYAVPFEIYKHDE